METHLQDRAPHREIATLLEETARCTIPEEAKKLIRRAHHLARVFTSLVAEFRASVPAYERKRGIQSGSVKRDARLWRPIEEAFRDNGWTWEHTELGDSMFNDYCPNWTLQQWIDEPVQGYDDRPSTIISVLLRGGVHVVREMIDNGLDLRKLVGLPSYVGGGLNLLAQLGPMYVWLNQLLLRMGNDERVGAEYLDYDWEERARCGGVPLPIQVVKARHVLNDGLRPYDNRKFRMYSSWSSLLKKIDSAEGASKSDILELSSQMFELIYRASHVFLYNELRHEKISNSVEFDLEDATLPDAKVFQLEVEVADDLVRCMTGLLPHIHGMKRKEYWNWSNLFDFWYTNGAVATKNLRKWRVTLDGYLNLGAIRSVTQMNRNLREVDIEIDNQWQYRSGNECSLWSTYRDLVTCFIDCAHLLKFTLRVGVCPFTDYDARVNSIRRILEKGGVQFDFRCGFKLMLLDKSDWF